MHSWVFRHRALIRRVYGATTRPERPEERRLPRPPELSPAPRRRLPAR